MDNKQQNGQQKPGGNGFKPPFGGPDRRWLYMLLPFLIFLPFITTMFTGTAQRGNEISYTRFLSEIERGNVREVSIAGYRIDAELNRPLDDTPVIGDGTSVYTYVPSFGDAEVMERLRQQNVTVYTRPAQEPVSFVALLMNILPLLLLVWIGFALFRNMRSQGRSIFSVGQNKAKLYERTEKERTTFADVAGLEGAKEEIMEVVDFLKYPNRFQKIGAKTPKGLLLVGPPGTGKTLIARAIAGEAGVPFYSMSGSDFMEMFVGVGASRVRNLFQDAKKRAPAIIFIDELDSVGRHRGAGLGGGHDEREQTLNQLLSELDGFEPNDTTIVVAATNRPDILDPALLRPGRFDRRITIDLPTVRDREAILKVHARNKPLADDVNLQTIAQGTPGFSGADLQNLLNEAALLAARQKRESITESDIEQARDKVLLGLERKNLTINGDERKIIAYHEAGHALTAALLPNTDPLFKVTIIPRENSLGVTQQLPKEEKYLYSKEYLQDRIVVMLGGRAAEEIVFKSVTSGAENDFREATRLARKMISDWGMSDKFGTFSSGSQRKNVFLGEELSHQREYSEETARLLDEEIQALLRRSHKQATEILTQRRKTLDGIAEALLQKEQLGANDVLQLINGSAESGSTKRSASRSKKTAEKQPKADEQTNDSPDQ